MDQGYMFCTHPCVRLGGFRCTVVAGYCNVLACVAVVVQRQIEVESRGPTRTTILFHLRTYVNSNLNTAAYNNNGLIYHNRVPYKNKQANYIV